MAFGYTWFILLAVSGSAGLMRPNLCMLLVCMLLAVSGSRLVQAVLPRMFSHGPFRARAKERLWGALLAEALPGHGVAVPGAE